MIHSFKIPNVAKIDVLNAVLIAIISLFLVFDLFFIRGHGVTFDGPTHIANIAMFHRGLSEGELRVEWGDGFANYGMPMPLVVQQMHSYLGAILTFVTQDVILSYNLVYLIGAFFSCLFFYIFLRFYFLSFASLMGVFIFNFAPYRIVNIYSRGALPEFFASVFVPLILIAIYLLIHHKNRNGFILLSLSVAGLIFSHPFLFIVTLFFVVPYIILELCFVKEKIKTLIFTLAGLALGVGLTALYILPLFSEIKYFMYGRDGAGLKPNHFLPLSNFTEFQWTYWGHEATRGYTIAPGILETSIFILLILYLLYKAFHNRLNNVAKQFSSPQLRLVLLSLIISIVLIIFSLQISEPLYTKIKLLGGIQYPWRMFSMLIFLPPIMATYLISHLRKGGLAISLGILVLIAIIRFPQLYTKNNILNPQSSYYFTIENMHGIIMNPIWTEASENYPVQKEKIAIIQGEGEVISKEVKNSQRKYQINALTPLRVVDYTFFFPGWKVYIDGKEVPIEFQDVAYRGVITYNVPEGMHQVQVKFIDTRVRKYGYVMSGISIILIILLYIFEKKYKFFLSNKN